MHTKRFSPLTRAGLMTAFSVFFLGFLKNPSNPPLARTGAPFDSTCNSGCHGSPSATFNGTIQIDGLPAEIQPNIPYSLTVSGSVSAGSPVQAGFELVVVSTSANTQAGTLAGGAGSNTAATGGRTYLRHSSAQGISGGGVSWSFTWTSPASVAGNSVSFYSTMMLGNGAGGQSGDKEVFGSQAVPFAGSAPVTVTMSGTNVTCFGGANGTATATPSGGNGTFSYAWSNGQSDQTATGLAVGTYSCTVTSGASSVTGSKAITQPTNINLTASAMGSITCQNQSATLTASASGGGGGFMFAWSDGQTGSPITVSAPGTYFLTATDAAGCTKTAQTTVAGNINPPTATAAANGILSCTNASVQLSASTNATNPAFSWTGPGAFSSNLQNPTVSAAGLYTVVVTNSANGCTAAASVNVVSNINPPTVSATGGTLTCTVSSLILQSSTNAAAPVFSWAGPNGFISGLQNPTVSAAGSYVLTVTNTQNGCSATATATVSQNQTQPTATATGGVLTCSATTVILQSSTNAPNPVFSWTGPNTFSSSLQNPPVSAAGDYVLTVSNPQNGCSATATATVILNNTVPTATATGGVLTCATTSLVLQSSTNAAAATFSWTGPNGFSSNLQNPTVSTSGSYVLTVTNSQNGCTNSATATVILNNTQPTATATGGTLTCTTTSVILQSSTNAATPLFSWAGPNGFISNLQNPTVSTAGSYVLTVTNSQNGCSATATATVSLNNAAPTATATGGVLTCSATSLVLQSSTNAATATFSWTGPNGFISNLQNPTVSTSGGYVLTISNTQNGCSATATAVVSQNTTSPTASITPPTVLNCNAATQQLNATASSQGATFSYQWTASNGGNVSAGATTLTPTITAAGNYSLLITNSANGCTASAATQVSQLSAVLASVSSQNVACFGGSTGAATASASGGTGGGFAFLWSNGATTASVSGLAAGVYSVTATDPAGGGCSATASATIAQPAILAANASATGETANGANNGTATAQPTGGTSPFSFFWSNNATTQTISNLAPGSFMVIVTDQKGCTSSQTVTVNSFACNVLGSILGKNVRCFGENNGSAGANLTGGALPISFAWSNGATTQSIQNLAAGSFSVSMTDANGCPSTASVVISQPAVLAANASATAQMANGQNDGTATAQPTGGNAPFTFFWSNNATTQTISGLAPGSFTVSVTDAKGCSAQQTVVVSAFNCAFSAQISAANASCFGADDGVATASAAGGNGPFTFLWSNGATSQTIENLVAGQYSVSMTDALGCFSVETTLIEQPAALQMSFPFLQNVVCPTDQNGSATVAATGGTAPFLFAWSNGQGGPTATGLAAGPFSVSATDANGCSKTISGQIEAIDNVAPIIVCPSNLTACPGAGFTFPMPSASDNCAGAIILTQTKGLPSGSVFPTGSTEMAFLAVDAAGNEAVCNFVVSVSPPISLMGTVTNATSGTATGSINLTVGGLGGNFLFSWKGPGGYTSVVEDPNGLFAGSYSVTATNPAGCTATATFLVGETVSTEENELAETVLIFPNPAGDVLFFELEKGKILLGEVIDAAGRRAKRLSKNEISSGQIDLSRLAAGVYFLKLEFEKGAARVFGFEKRE